MEIDLDLCLWVCLKVLKLVRVMMRLGHFQMRSLLTCLRAVIEKTCCCCCTEVTACVLKRGGFQSMGGMVLLGGGGGTLFSVQPEILRSWWF